MVPFEDALLQHRTELVKYLADWSVQQESLCARYARGDCRESTGLGVCAPEQEKCGHSLKALRWSVESPREIESLTGDAEQTLASTRRHSHDSTCRQFPSVPAFPAEDDWVCQTPASDRLGHQYSFEAGTSVRWATTRVQGTFVDSRFSSAGIKAAISHATTLHFHDDDKNVRSDFFAEAVESSAFTYTLACVIVLNVAFMAIAVDLELDSAKRGEEPNKEIVVFADAFFTACYIAEIVLKLAAYGKDYLVGDDWRWNIFDMVVVVSGIVDLLTTIFIGSGANLIYLRMNRIVKLIKVVRVVKVYRTFKELRLIVGPIMRCGKKFCWAIALITIVLFTFALLFVQGVTEYISMHPLGEPDDTFLGYWGSIGRAMVSLFQATTGGESWSAMAEPLLELGWVYYGVFMVYICFFMFVVVNVLTGLFVDAALAASSKDDAIMIREEMSNKEAHVQLIQTLFSRLDSDGSGELTLQKVEEGMNSAEMQAFASAIDIEIADIREFFKLVSADGRNLVDIETFVVGCMKLKGSAKSLDLVSLSHRIKMLEQQILTFIGRTDQRLKEQQVLLGRAL